MTGRLMTGRLMTGVSKETLVPAREACECLRRGGVSAGVRPGTQQPR